MELNEARERLLKLGWRPPPPKRSLKLKDDFLLERVLKVAEWEAQGLLKSERVKSALLRVPREDYIPLPYRDYAYEEVPLPLPGGSALTTPMVYPFVFEVLRLERGKRFLELGTGSGYGAALAWEVVGPEGLVVSVEIAKITFAFAQRNLNL